MKLWRLDRDFGELLWREEKDTALDDVERAIRLGVLEPVEIDELEGDQS